MGLERGMLIFKEILSPQDMGKEVIRRIIYNRIEMKKNCFFMLVGDSGEGKSYTALRIAEIVQEDFDPKTQVVYTPDQYLDVINYAVEKRKTKVIILDEAHVTIPARLWLSFTNLAVGLVTTTFRRLKSLAVLIVSPDINWVEKMVRESCNYYAICERKRRGGNYENVYADVFRVLRNRYDIEKTKTYLRRIPCYSVPLGKTYIIEKLVFSLPSQQLIDAYEECSYKFKKMLLERKLLEIKKQISRSLNVIISVDEAIRALQESEELREAVLRYDKKGKAILKKSALNYFKLTDLEFVRLQREVENLFSMTENQNA